MKKRKIEVYRLTISGIGDNQDYSNYLHKMFVKAGSLSQRVMTSGERSHALHEAKVKNRRIRLRFMSYATGFRPDVFDTEQFRLAPNPLTPSQTGVDWTHVLGGQVGDRYVLLVERVHSGLYPTTLERYLQWLVDKFESQNTAASDSEQGEPITISLETEPGGEFITRMDSMTRITKATVRTVRPNPGWGDLERELGKEAQDSDAHKADLTMSARRNSSLSRDKGIVAAIRRLFSQKKLDYAAIEGEKGSEKESFNTKHLGKHSYLMVEQDNNGQVQPDDIWTKLSEIIDKLD